jgi:hypothetical protein
MRTRLTAALLLGGHLLLTLTPIAASSASARPAARPSGDDHYRCMYHCRERYGDGDGDRDRGYEGSR